MKVIKIRKSLHDFLKQHDALDALLSQANVTYITNLWDCGFEWYYSDEGKDYWATLSQKYEELDPYLDVAVGGAQ